MDKNKYFETNEKLIEEGIRELYLRPRLKRMKWSKITNQSIQADAYVGQQIVSLVTGIKGTGSRGRGDDLADESEIKSAIRIDQMCRCNDCKYTFPSLLDKECPKCGSKNYNQPKDSHASIRLATNHDLETLINLPAIYNLLIDASEDKENHIRIRIWKIDPTREKAKEFFKGSLENNKTKGSSNVNFHPLKRQWHLMEPEMIFLAETNETGADFKTKFYNLDYPEKELMPIKLLNIEEIKSLYPNVIFKKNCSKVEMIKQIGTEFLSEELMSKVEMKVGNTFTYKNPYDRRKK